MALVIESKQIAPEARKQRRASERFESLTRHSLRDTLRRVVKET